MGPNIFCKFCRLWNYAGFIAGTGFGAGALACAGAGVFAGAGFGATGVDVIVVLCSGCGPIVIFAASVAYIAIFATASYTGVKPDFHPKLCLTSSYIYNNI